MQTEIDISENQLLEASKDVIQFVHRYTADVGTAKAILSVASAAFGGGFIHSVQVRLEGCLSPSERSEVPQQSAGGV